MLVEKRRAWGITVDAEGNVYVADTWNHRIQKFDANGNFVIVFSSAGIPLAAFGQYGPEEDAFGLPVGIVSDAEGRIWIVDAGNNRLAKFDLWK